MYSWLKPLLFCLPPETAHSVALKSLACLPAGLFPAVKQKPIQAFNLNFPHAIGLAAGFDKNGQYLDALAKLGFAFIEVGTVTPRSQPGNPKPRIFRLPQAQALINRMGFNNGGVDCLIKNIQSSHYKGILGINIGKNKDTPLREAVDDYRLCLQKVYPFASYITINISSPNTPDLRLLQHGTYFSQLISELVQEQQRLSDKYQKKVPLVVKISPDETDDSLRQLGELCCQEGIAGLIATNTTCSRAATPGLKHANELGGLSGQPLADRSTRCLSLLRSIVGEKLILIASGGVDSPTQLKEKMNAGANLVQIYTGLIYQGPGLVEKLVNA